MAATLHGVASVNGFSTTLNGAIIGTDVSITLTSVTGLPTGGGILVIDRVDGSGTLTPITREYVSFTGITTNTLTGCTRGIAGSTAQAHSSGAIIEEVWSVTHVLDLIEFLEVEHGSDGTHGEVTATSVSSDTLLAKATDTPITHSNGHLTTPVLYTPSASATATLDVSNSNIHSITMPEGNITIDISNETVGQCFLVEITQDGAGTRTVTWAPTIRWTNGVEPTLTTTASKRDSFGLRCTGTDTFDGYVVGQNL